MEEIKLAFEVNDVKGGNVYGNDLHLEKDLKVAEEYPNKDWVLNWGIESFLVAMEECQQYPFQEKEWNNLKVGDESIMYGKINGQTYKLINVITEVELDLDPVIEDRENEVNYSSRIGLVTT